MLTREEFMALHRHYIWLRLIKEQHESVPLQPNEGNSLVEFFISPRGAYMSLWYGLLFGILEVLKKRNVSVPKVQSDIESIYDSLRLYRNAIFHPQPQYFSPKMGKIAEDPQAVKKIWDITSALGDFFLEEFKRLDSGIPGHYVKP